MRTPIAFLILIATISISLAGCGGASSAGAGTSDSAAAVAPTSDGNAQTASIPTPFGVGPSEPMHGTVTWPDGTPVSNQTLDCNSNADQTWSDTVTTDVNGSYTYQAGAIDVTCHIIASGDIGLTTIDPDGNHFTSDGCDILLIPTPVDPNAGNKYMASPHEVEVDWQTDAYCLHPGDADVLSAEQEESQAVSGGASGWQALKNYLVDHPSS